MDNSALNFANPSAQAFTGTISGTGSLTKSGAGTLTLKDNSLFSGTTIVGGGVLALGSAQALLHSTLDTSGSGTVSFDSLTTAVIGGLEGSGGLALNNTAGGGVSLTVGKTAPTPASTGRFPAPAAW